MKDILKFFLLATVYECLKRMNYMDVAGCESIYVTINDAVMHASKGKNGNDLGKNKKSDLGMLN